MHLYFSGIGGSGLSPLAHLALDMGFKVSGSDLEENENTLRLREKGVRISIGQTGEEIKIIHSIEPIDWLVYTSSLPIRHPELVFAGENGIKFSKRDELINAIIKKGNLKLLAVAGTHGKTTTTAMLVWLFQRLNLPVSYLIGTNIGWADSGKFENGSQFLIMEADEYDKNFLAYKAYASIITTLDYDHPDTYPTNSDYIAAFREFSLNSIYLVGFSEDLRKLEMPLWQDKSRPSKNVWMLTKYFAGKIADYNAFHLPGLHNRQNAALVKCLFSSVIAENFDLNKNQEIEEHLSEFPGTQRRMEKLANNIYTDYAHHPVEIKATLQMAGELSQDIVVVYQPHQNLRQLQIFEEYRDSFLPAKKIYWLPTYIVREPENNVLTPKQLIAQLQNAEFAEPAELDSGLVEKLKLHHSLEDMIIVMGAGPIDAWFRSVLEKIVF